MTNEKTNLNKVVLIHNRYDRGKDEVIYVEYGDRTCKEIFQDSFKELNFKEWKPVVNNKFSIWTYRPKPSEPLGFSKPINASGGKASQFLGPAMGVAVGVLMIAAQNPLGWVMLATTVLGVAVSALSKPKMNEEGDSATYSWGQIQNSTGEGTVVPIVYGRHRQGGHYIELFSQSSMPNNVKAGQNVLLNPNRTDYLYALTALSEGPVAWIEEWSLLVNNKYRNEYEDWDYDGYYYNLVDQTFLEDVYEKGASVLATSFARQDEIQDASYKEFEQYIKFAIPFLTEDDFRSWAVKLDTSNKNNTAIPDGRSGVFMQAREGSSSASLTFSLNAIWFTPTPGHGTTNQIWYGYAPPADYNIYFREVGTETWYFKETKRVGRYPHSGNYYGAIYELDRDPENQNFLLGNENLLDKTDFYYYSDTDEYVMPIGIPFAKGTLDINFKDDDSFDWLNYEDKQFEFWIEKVTPDEIDPEQALTEIARGETYLKQMYLDGELTDFTTNGYAFYGYSNSNLTTITTYTRNGDIQEDPINDFNKVVREYPQVDQEVQYQSPWTYNSDEELNRAGITFYFPQLYRLNDDGQPASIDVELKVQYKLRTSGTWLDYGLCTCSNANAKEVRFQYVMDLPEAAEYDIRVHRLSGDFDEATEFGRSYIEEIVEYEDTQISYINTAKLGTVIKADENISGSAPNLSVIVYGRVLYDVKNGGTRWSNNLADIVYDILTNTRYGLGKWFNADNLDMYSLIEVWDWCNELVDFYYDWPYEVKDYEITEGYYSGQIIRDPVGGLYYVVLRDLPDYLNYPITDTNWFAEATYDPIEGVATARQRRYEINFIVDKEYSMTDLIFKLCSTCRVTPYFYGSKLKFAIDRENTGINDNLATYNSFTMANIVADSYEETAVQIDDIPTQCRVSFKDESDDYNEAQLTVIDKDRQFELPVTKTLNLYGLTNEARVRREVEFNMRKLKLTRKTAKFQCGLDGITCEPGDVIRVSHDKPKYGESGHIISVDPNFNRIYFDRTIEFVENESYICRIRYQSGENAFFNFAGPITGGRNYIDLPSEHSANPDDTYAIGEPNKESELLRVTALNIGKDNLITVEATQYSPELYNEEPITIATKEPKFLGGGQGSGDGGGTTDPGNPPVDPGDKFPTDPTIPPYVTGIYLKTIHQQSSSSTVVVDTEASSGFLPPKVSINWTEVSMPSTSSHYIDYYNILYSEDLTNWVTLSTNERAAREIETPELEYGKTYYFIVLPYTEQGITNDTRLSQYRDDASITPTQPTPGVINGVTTYGGFREITLEIDYVDNNTFKHFEVWSSSTNVIEESDWWIESKSKTVTQTNLEVTETRYYWVRIRNIYGNAGPWFPLDFNGIVGQTNDDPDFIIPGEIPFSKLDEYLQEQINMNWTNDFYFEPGTVDGDYVEARIDVAEDQITLLVADVDENTSNISTLTIRADEIELTVAENTTTIDGHTLSITQLELDVDSITSRVATVETDLDGEITTRQSEVQQLADRYSVKIQSTGPGGENYATGFGLGLDDTGVSEFVVSSDFFKVLNPSDPSAKRPVFVLDTGTVPPRMVLDGDLVVSESIVADAIVSSKIKADNITTRTINGGAAVVGWSTLSATPFLVGPGTSYDPPQFKIYQVYNNTPAYDMDIIVTGYFDVGWANSSVYSSTSQSMTIATDIVFSGGGIIISGNSFVGVDGSKYPVFGGYNGYTESSGSNYLRTTFTNHTAYQATIYSGFIQILGIFKGAYT